MSIKTGEGQGNEKGGKNHNHFSFIVLPYICRAVWNLPSL